MNKPKQSYLTYCLDVPKEHLSGLGIDLIVREITLFDESYYLTLILCGSILLPSSEEEEEEAQEIFSLWNELYEGSLELLESEVESNMSQISLSDPNSPLLRYPYPSLSEEGQRCFSDIIEYLIELLYVRIIRPLKRYRPETKEDSLLCLTEVLDFGDVYRLFFDHINKQD